MNAPRLRGALVMSAAVALAACGGSTSEPGGITPSAVAVVSGNGQVGLVGSVLAVPLAVKVTANGSSVRGASVSFAVTAGAASVSPATATTDTAGVAKTQLTLGSSPGNVTVTATVAGTSLAASFVETVAASQTTQACTSSAATTPTVGSVQPGLSGTGICLGGGATGAEYALVAFYGNTDSSAVQSFTVTGKGATGVTSSSNLVPTGAGAASPLFSRSVSNNLRAELDVQRRITAQRELTPLMPDARAQMKRSALRSMIPSNPTLGSLVTLNANGVQSCSAPKNRTSRIAAVSQTAIVVADTGNPAGGFTDAEYLSFARMFDTLISPLATSTFGTHGDVDGNGKVVLFFTKEVNALTPKSGAGGTVGAFFFERDLFPLSTTNGLTGCAGSNFAEMAYLLVPDPQGVFSIAHTKQDVLEITPATLIHEYQHLINASRRLYTNNASDFEDVWLNEGLSHIGEELLYYRVAGLAPRQNIGFQQIGASQASVNFFNEYQGDNNGRFELFLSKPNLTSVYGSGDALETRGAIWHLLRYLADHRGSSDADTWTQLVNTTATGQQNLSRVFGANYMTQIRDWATTVFTDDFTGITDQRFLESSWNMRSIFPRLVNSAGQPLNRYPLAVVPVSDATPANVSLFAGGAAYMRFSVPASGQASIDWTANGLPVSGLMQFTLVRTK
jgi:hypothetical protein